MGYVAESSFGWDGTFVLLLVACDLSVVFVGFTYKEEQYLALAFMSCENQNERTSFVDSERVHVDTINRIYKSAGLRSQYAVVAHRGSTYWTRKKPKQLTVGLVKWVPIIWRQTYKFLKMVLF